jgi:hypothetical protein
MAVSIWYPIEQHTVHNELKATAEGRTQDKLLFLKRQVWALALSGIVSNWCDKPVRIRTGAVMRVSKVLV